MGRWALDLWVGREARTCCSLGKYGDDLYEEVGAGVEPQR